MSARVLSKVPNTEKLMAGCFYCFEVLLFRDFIERAVRKSVGINLLNCLLLDMC